MSVKDTLFVGDLPSICIESELVWLFSQHGRVKSVIIKTIEGTEQNIRYGFVQFISAKEAAKVIANCGNMILKDRLLRINWAVNRNHFQSTTAVSTTNDSATTDIMTNDIIISRSSNALVDSSYTLQLSYATSQIRNLVTEESILHIFQPFGHVIGVTLKKKTVNKSTLRQFGHGFVHFHKLFDGMSSALMASRTLHKFVISDVEYECNVSYALRSEMEKQRQQQQRQMQLREQEEMTAVTVSNNNNGVMLAQHSHENYSSHSHHHLISASPNVTHFYNNNHNNSNSAYQHPTHMNQVNTDRNPNNNSATQHLYQHHHLPTYHPPTHAIQVPVTMTMIHSSPESLIYSSSDNRSFNQAPSYYYYKPSPPPTADAATAQNNTIINQNNHYNYNNNTHLHGHNGIVIDNSNDAALHHVYK